MGSMWQVRSTFFFQRRSSGTSNPETHSSSVKPVRLEGVGSRERSSDAIGISHVLKWRSKFVGHGSIYEIVCRFMESLSVLFN